MGQDAAVSGEFGAYGQVDAAAQRTALLKAWGWRCYWGMHPLEFVDCQVDHVIPKDEGNGQARLNKHQKERGMAQTTINDLSNLAPICGPCNLAKSNTDFSNNMLYVMHIYKAFKLKPVVEKHLQAILSGRKLVESLVHASQADLSSPKSRSDFKDFAPAIVRRLWVQERELFARTSLPLESLGFLEELPHGSWTRQVDLQLDEAGREALSVLRFLNLSLNDLVRRVLDELPAASARELEGRLGGDADSGGAEVDLGEVSIDLVECEGEPTSPSVMFAGEFSAEVTASVVAQSADGDQLVFGQTDGYITEARFTASVDCVPSASGWVLSEHVEIDALDFSSDGEWYEPAR